jgi:HlyD family type I secretion membrane fusion protein
MSLTMPGSERDIFVLSDRLMERGPPIHRIVVTAIAIAAVALGGFGVWAALAPLATGAIAAGNVRVDTNKKTVQHLEGGIIREILVREGDRVRAGQVLVRLDPVAAKADRSVLQNQLLTTLAEEARLTAERDGANSIALPPQLLSEQQRPEVAAIVATQAQIFRSQRWALESDIAVQLKKVGQQQAQVDALTKQIATTQRQITLFAEELKTAQELLEKGYERKPRVLGLQRNIAQTEGDLSSLLGRLDTAKETIAESQAQIEALRQQRGKAISEDLEKVRAKRAEVEQQLQKTSDKLDRVDVVAPQDGLVLGMKFFSPGAVVGTGGAILDIIPADENLVMYVKLNPLDIDVVREGLPAQVRLVAYKQRIVPTLAGRVTQVSADAVVDETSKGQFYMVRVEVSPSELAHIPNVKLYPGMPVEAVILTGERTVLDYLLRPLLDSFAHAFREQ